MKPVTDNEVTLGDATHRASKIISVSRIRVANGLVGVGWILTTLTVLAAASLVSSMDPRWAALTLALAVAVWINAAVVKRMTR